MIDEHSYAQPNYGISIAAGSPGVLWLRTANFSVLVQTVRPHSVACPMRTPLSVMEFGFAGWSWLHHMP